MTSSLSNLIATSFYGLPLAAAAGEPKPPASFQESAVELILVVAFLTNLSLLGSSRLASCIKAIAIQGVVLGLLPLFIREEALDLRLLAFALVTLGVKGYMFPVLLTRSLREVNVTREDQPWVGYSASLLSGILILGLSFWMAAYFELPPLPHKVTGLVLPVALSTILIGLFVIISRKLALMQVIGYLVMENGIYIFGVALAQEYPLLVEMGILLDVFVAVFVMGIAIFHISREFDHIDVDQLSNLKD